MHYLPLLLVFGFASGSEILIPENKPLEIPDFNYSIPYFTLSNAVGVIDVSTFSLFTDLGVLTLSASSIEEITPETFKSTPVLRILEISDNTKFPTVTKEMFKYCNSVDTFAFINNTNTKLENGALSLLTNLEYLVIRKQNYKTISKGIFGGIPQLERLDLTENGIENIDEDAFSELPNLKQLDLKKNKLNGFLPDTFVHQRKVTQFRIDSNGFEELNWSILAKLVSLQELNVNGNRLTQLDVNKLSSTFPNLKYVSFSPNNFTCSVFTEIVEKVNKLLHSDMMADCSFLERESE